MLKYNIEEKLKTLTQEEFNLAIKNLHKLLGVTKSTIWKWRNIKFNEKKEIKAKHLIDLANFFDCKVTDIYSYQSEVPALASLKENKITEKIKARHKITIPAEQ